MKILKNSEFKTTNGVKILRIEGTGYEMGFQHGYLLAEGINIMLTYTLPSMITYLAVCTGLNYADTLQNMYNAQKMSDSYIPDFLLEEMNGIVDGARSKGVNVRLKEIKLFNIIYDLWCYYTSQKFINIDSENSNIQGCSSFSAWGNATGKEGKLIFCKNEDNYNFPGQLDNRIFIVACPEYGAKHAFFTFPGMIGLDGGFNNEGLSLMTQRSSTVDDAVSGCGIALFTRINLTSSKNLKDSIEIFNKYQSSSGIAYHVADAKAKLVAAIEVSPKKVCIRYPEDEMDYFWQTNHSNCFPGWMGYEGENMVETQAPIYRIDATNIEKWQRSLRNIDNTSIPAAGRFERYRQLLTKYYGNINVENSIRILRDRYDPYTNRTRLENLSCKHRNNLSTICAMYPVETYKAPEPVGSFKANVATLWSLITYPATGEFWIASNEFPAPYGEYYQFNLNEFV